MLGRCSLWNGIIGDTMPRGIASGKVTISAISPAQSRAARGLLDWSRDRLAEQCQVAKRTIVRFEASEGETREATLAAIRTALEAAGEDTDVELEAAGVEFTNGDAPGVRLRSQQHRRRDA